MNHVAQYFFPRNVDTVPNFDANAIGKIRLLLFVFVKRIEKILMRSNSTKEPDLNLFVFFFLIFFLLQITLPSSFYTTQEWIEKHNNAIINNIGV